VRPCSLHSFVNNFSFQSIHRTGGAWCFYQDPKNRVEQTFSFPYSGCPLASNNDPEAPRRFSLYGWHILDSIGFSQDLRVTVQALGWKPGRKYLALSDDIASVASWYQLEPHTKFPPFPSTSAR
jgi:hypothetical protein